MRHIKPEFMGFQSFVSVRDVVITFIAIMEFGFPSLPRVFGILIQIVIKSMEKYGGEYPGNLH